MSSKHPIIIKAAPRVGQLYWCNLHPEAVIHIPEMWKKRPVVVISRKNHLSGKVIVLPITTSDMNENYPGSIELSHEIQSLLDARRAWVVCDHPMTVATSRLDYINRKPIRIGRVEMGPILQLCHDTIAGGSSSLV